MKKSRFTETQIVKAIKEHENGRKAEDLCRELGISTVTFYNLSAARQDGNSGMVVWKPAMSNALRNWKKRTRSLSACMPT
jgi:hypothetical protein